MISFEILENITFFLMEYLNSWCHHLKCLALGFLIKSKYFMSAFHIYLFDFPVFIKFKMWPLFHKFSVKNKKRDHFLKFIVKKYSWKANPNFVTTIPIIKIITNIKANIIYIWKNFMSPNCTNSHYENHETFVPSINHNKDVALLSYVELYLLPILHTYKCI